MSQTMTSLFPGALRAWHQDGIIHVSLADGRDIRFPVRENPRLSAATHEALNQIEISPFGLHWPLLDEDLSIAGLLKGNHGQP
jgi:hypothetical protein